jgi:uncharacterized metal-binding protein YceD (DUF177 family)
MEKPVIVPWSVPVVVNNIPESGLHIEIDAPAAVREQVLALVEGLSTVHDLASLSAVFDLTLRGSEVHVAGHVRAKVGQTCVVTLEPIENGIDEEVDLTFAPSVEGVDDLEGEVELKRDLDPPEPLTGDSIDLGQLATEFLVLGIDPYPRKSGVEFAPRQAGEDTPKPFAGLAALKKRLGGDDQ